MSFSDDLVKAENEYNQLKQKAIELHKKLKSFADDDPQRDEIKKLWEHATKESLDVYLRVYALAKTDSQREFIDDEFALGDPFLSGNVLSNYRDKMQWRIEQIRANDPEYCAYQQQKERESRQANWILLGCGVVGVLLFWLIFMR